jgi:hypothetical protein
MPRPSATALFPRRSLTAAILLLAAASARAEESTPAQNTSLAIPPRLQWNANHGYCGETSFISAGLYFGQYCSQFTARSLASPGVPQSSPNSQLLLGVNDLSAAQALHLAAFAWKPSPASTPADFLVWVETQILAGHPVAIGVFTNEYLFYGNTTPTAGDPNYDHIVPVLGISQQPPAANPPTYNPADSLTFSDNGLWAPPPHPPAFLFTYTLDEFPKTRTEANAKSGPIYSLKSNGKNYGIAFTSVADLNHDTIPVRVTTSTDSELPAMKNGDNTPPPPEPITLTVTVSLPDQSAAYNLYCYSSFTSVPDSKFNANARQASAHWLIPAHSGPAFVVKLPILSNQIAAFRAVQTTAP